MHQQTAARARADQLPLTVARIRKVVLSVHTRDHDSGTDEDVAELIPELLAFNIATVKSLRRLMQRHRQALRQEERIRMRHAETLGQRETFGPLGLDMHRDTSRYSIGGLVRASMEHEFGFQAMLPFHEIREE